MRRIRAAAAFAVVAIGLGLCPLAASASDSQATSEAPATSPEASRVGGSPESILDVLRDPDAFARARRLSILLPTLGPEAVPEVRRALASPAVDRGAVEIVLLVQLWATHDPASAAHWAFTQAPPGFRAAATLPSVETWAGSDPEAALTWMRELPVAPGVTTMAAQIALVRGWFDSGRPGLEDYIQSLGPSFDRQRALSVFARKTIQRNGPIALMRWAESLPDEPQRFKLSAFRQVGSELAQADPAAAVAWCDAQCAGPFGSNVRKLVATGWVAQDGPAAMEWLSAAPAGTERDLAVRVAFLSWLRRDRQAALGWMEAIGLDGVEAWLRPALDLYALPISGERPAEAIRWAALIDDDARRKAAFITIARRWREQDANTAEAWLEQSPLSEEARERARTPTPKPREPRPHRSSQGN